MAKCLSLFWGALLVSTPLLGWASKQPEALEKYELSSLSYWRQGPEECVYLLDPEGYVHLALLGSGIGKNHGKITAITSNELEITELIQGSDGKWHETKSSLKAVGRVHPE